MSIKATLNQLAPKKTNALTSLPAPEIINGTVGRLDWGTVGAGSSKTTTNNKAAPAGVLTEEIQITLPDDSGRPKEFLKIASSPVNVASFNMLGYVETPRIAEWAFEADANTSGELVVKVTFGGDFALDELNLGKPVLSLAIDGATSMTQGWFEFMYDYAGRYYGSVESDLIKDNPDGSHEYLVQAVINMDRNFAVFGDDLVALKQGWAGYELLQRVAVNDALKQDSNMLVHACVKLGIEEVEAWRADMVCRYALGRAPSARGSSMAIYTGSYSDEYIGNNLPFIYAPAPKDMYKIKVSSEGDILSTESLHQATLEDYLPFLTDLVVFKPADNIVFSADEMDYVNKKTYPGVFEFEVGKQYKAKTRAETDGLGRVVFTEAGCRFATELEIKATNKQYFAVLEAPNNAAKATVIRPAGLELSIELFGLTATAERIFCNQLPAGYSYDERSIGLIYCENGNATAGILGDAAKPVNSIGERSFSYGDHARGFDGFYNDGRLSLNGRVFETGFELVDSQILLKMVKIRDKYIQFQPKGHANSFNDDAPDSTYEEFVVGAIDPSYLP